MTFSLGPRPGLLVLTERRLLLLVGTQSLQALEEYLLEQIESVTSTRHLSGDEIVVSSPVGLTTFTPRDDGFGRKLRESIGKETLEELREHYGFGRFILARDGRLHFGGDSYPVHGATATVDSGDAARWSVKTRQGLFGDADVYSHVGRVQLTVTLADGSVQTESGGPSDLGLMARGRPDQRRRSVWPHRGEFHEAPSAPVESLAQLAQRRDAGVLTAEEFESKKWELLDRI